MCCHFPHNPIRLCVRLGANYDTPRIEEKSVKRRGDKEKWKKRKEVVRHKEKRKEERKRHTLTLFLKEKEKTLFFLHTISTKF